MALSISLVEDGCGVYLQATGQITGLELSRGLTNFLKENQGQFHHFHYWFSDFSACELVDFESHWVQNLADFTRSAVNHQDNVFAAMATADDLTFGIIRMWQSLADLPGWEIEVCRSRAEAEAWFVSRLGKLPPLFRENPAQPGTA